MKFSLSAIVLEPLSKIKPKNAVILCHGYGGDGKDISILAGYWRTYLPDTIFICPDAPEKCEASPSGFQWFDLTSDNSKYILEQSKKAELKLKEFIDEVKNKYNLDNSQICLVGFSQGCMMALNLGLINNNENFNCIVGFSGKVIDEEDLKNRMNSSTKTLLIHGDKDEVVSPTFLLEAKDFLIRNNVDVETKLIKNCGHQIPVEASSYALNYIKNNLNVK